MHGFGFLIFHCFSFVLFLSRLLKFRTFFNIFPRFSLQIYFFNFRLVSPLASIQLELGFIYHSNQQNNTNGLRICRNIGHKLPSTLQSCISFWWAHNGIGIWPKSKTKPMPTTMLIIHSGMNRTMAKYDVLSNILFDGIVWKLSLFYSLG